MNKTLKAIFIILAVYFIGELISIFIKNILPGSAIGMLLLFICLQAKIIKEDSIASLVDAIIKNLPLLFLAPSVGIITIYDSIKDDIIAITTAAIISSIGVIITVGFLLEKFINKKKK